MGSELLTVLWISAVGAAFLFVAFTGLVLIIYVLTLPWPPRVWRRRGVGMDGERIRRAQAVAVAVAVVCAKPVKAVWVPADAPSGWRQLHRTRRLESANTRRKWRT